jgi:hypothetical protein
MSRKLATPNTHTPLSAQEMEALAVRRAHAKLGWYGHAAVYACVITGLALIGAWQGRVWPVAPALGWGLGLALHAARVFAIDAGAGWRNSLVERERQRLQRNTTPEATQ